MSSIHTYLPLYRRYRPQAFTDLVGQEVICQTLGNAILHDQVAHAYLFCGPRGTGKTSTARIFAKALNCTHQQPGANPCNQCDSCQSITLGNALDVIEFDAASNNKVEDARELIEGCQFAPMSGGYKVYIIDEVHMLTTQAFNTLLKTLEEPPPNVIFIFATTEAHKVLPTIVSRCQRFDFSRIDSATIVKRLQTIAQVEQIAITDAALLRVARQAHGGLRDAVGLLDQLSVLARAEAGKTVDVADVALLVGAVQEDRLLALSQAMANYQAQGVLDTVSGLLADGIEPSQLVRDLTQHFRNLLIVQVSGDQATASSTALDLDADYLAALQAQAQQYLTLPNTHQRVPDLLNRLAKLAATLRHSQQPELWLEIALVDMALAMDPWSELQDLKSRVAALEQGAPAPAAAPTTAPEARAIAPSVIPVSAPPVSAVVAASVPPTPAPPPPIVAAPEAAVPSPPPVVIPPAVPVGNTGPMDVARWRGLCERVKNGAYRSLLLQHTHVLQLDAQRLLIGCSSEPIMNLLKAPQKLGDLQSVVDEAIAPGLQLVIELAKAPTASSAPRSTPPAPAPVVVPPPVASPNPTVMAHPTPETAAAYTSPVVVHLTPQQAPAAPGFSAIEDDLPPDDDGPPLEDWEDADRVAVSPGSAPSAPPDPSTVATDPGLLEAKQFTMSLLHGKIVD